MNEQIQKVQYIIERNLDISLDLDDLARIAGYSKYHFSRSFKLNTGESITDYITRLRLEKAQLKIIQKTSIIDVALDVGYETPNGFNKAFKKTFGITPTKYKKIKKDFLEKFRGTLIQTPTIVTLEDKFVIFTRELGDYHTSTEIAWNRLMGKLKSFEEKLKDSNEKISINMKEAELFGICHDDPTVTKAENIRYDACIYLSNEKSEYLQKNGFETKKIDGGKYVMTRRFGNCDGSLDSWLGLYSWCEQNGYTFRDLPPFEKYVNFLEIDNPNEQITEIYIPIKD